MRISERTRPAALCARSISRMVPEPSTVHLNRAYPPQRLIFGWCMARCSTQFVRLSRWFSRVGLVLVHNFFFLTGSALPS